MPKHQLERARAMMTDAALAPAMKVALDERDIARSAAVEAARSIPAEEVRVELPPTGRISYAHLRRWHPEAAAQLMEKLSRAGEARPEVAEAVARYRAAVDALRGTQGARRGPRGRATSATPWPTSTRGGRNAALRTIAPDRTEAPTEIAEAHRSADRRPGDPPPSRAPHARGGGGVRPPQGAGRCRARRPRAQARPGEGVLERLPSYRSAVGLASSAAGRAALRALATAANPNRRRDLGDEAGEAAARILAKAALAALRAALVAGKAGNEINRQIRKEIRI
ncbi:MAG: hypothetical protein ACLTSX_12190 [Collinsella sp.]